jgi:alkylation response protein AidB-like acyl-CoA dehydrogenase
MVTTTSTSESESFRLNGRKWCATGTVFADYDLFSANDSTGQLVV